MALALSSCYFIPCMFPPFIPPIAGTYYNTFKFLKKKKERPGPSLGEFKEQGSGHKTIMEEGDRIADIEVGAHSGDVTVSVCTSMREEGRGEEVGV